MTPESLKVQQYRRTVKGLLTLIYSNQKMTSKKMGRALPSYSKEQLMDWVTNQVNFNQLFTNWVTSGYDKFLSPSVDRKDNTLGYTLGNIQLVTWRDNLLNQKRQNISGTHLHTKSKAIRQFDVDGNEVAVYGSVANAARAVNGRRSGNSNIAGAADGRLQSAYGYMWQWA